MKLNCPRPMIMLQMQPFTNFMLQRDRQIRTQVHQLTDACLFAISFWLAFAVRGNGRPQIVSLALASGSIPPEMFERMGGFFSARPAAPLVLESQGFYNRPAVIPAPALFLAAVARR
jgi:hypothetical protein